MRLRLLAPVTALLIAGPTVLAFFSGGFFERPRLIASVAVWALAAVAALAAPTPLPRSAVARTALAALAALAAWTALSSEWAPLGERAQADVQRLLLYLGAFAAGLALLRGPLVRRFMAPAVAGGTLVVAAYGLADRLLPGLFTFRHSPSAQGRLEQPLTYWNAMGCLSAMGLVLCLRLAADARPPGPVRAAAALASPTLGLAVYLSFSRGALFALAAGIGLLVLLAPGRGHQAKVAALLVAGGAIAAVVATRLPEVESLPAGQQGDTQQGLVMLAVLLIVSAGCAFAVLRAPAKAPSQGRRNVVPARRQLLLAAAVAVVVSAGLAGVAALEPSPESGGAGASRLGSTDTLRYTYWEVALDAFARHPVQGTGAGGFAVDWRRQPERAEPAVDAHSLYIETLSELGLAGAALLLLFLGAILVAATRSYARDAAATAGPAAALLVWAVHAGIDWDWEMPALTGVAVLLAAALVAWQDEEDSRDRAGPASAAA